MEYQGRHLRMYLNNQGASIQWWSDLFTYRGATLWFKPKVRLVRITSRR